MEKIKEIDDLLNFEDTLSRDLLDKYINIVFSDKSTLSDLKTIKILLIHIAHLKNHINRLYNAEFITSSLDDRWEMRALIRDYFDEDED